MGTKIIKINCIKEYEGYNFNSFLKVFKTKFKEKDLVLFIDSVCEFLKINKDLIFCFESSLHCLKAGLVQSFKKIIYKMKKGQNLSSILIESKSFPEYFISLIKVGESSNDFSKTFNTLKDFINWKLEQDKKFIVSMIYPAFTFITFSVVLFLFSSYVIPNILEVLNQSNVDINLGSFFMFLSFLKSFFIFLTISMLLLYFISVFNKLLFEKIKYNLPMVGSFFIVKEIFWTSYYIKTAQETGLSIIDSLDVCIDCCASLSVKSLINNVKSNLIKGKTISGSLNCYNFFDTSLVNIRKTGENSGNLINSFNMINRVYGSKYRNYIEKMMIILPVALILFIAFLIISFVFLIFFPLYSMGI